MKDESQDLINRVFTEIIVSNYTPEERAKIDRLVTLLTD